MNTVNIADTQSQTDVQISNRDDWIKTYDNLYEQKSHGSLDYPINIYYLDLRKSYLNYIRWHWHEEMEILIINDGIAEVSTDDATYTIKPGQAVIINQNAMHTMHPLEQQKCTFYSLVFHPDFLFGHKNNYLQTKYLLPVQNQHLFKMLVLDEKNEWHERMMDAINDTIAINLTKPFGYEIETKGHLCRFWSLLISQLPRLKASVAIPQVSLDEQRVKQAMLYIRTHYAEPISLEDIADSIHVSKSECCRCFSRTLQVTPFEYLMKLRIYEATKLLLDTSDQTLSVAETAASVGFNNTSYFNKLFKKYVGCTPTYYRNHYMVSEKQLEQSPFAVPLL